MLYGFAVNFRTLSRYNGELDIGAVEPVPPSLNIVYSPVYGSLCTPGSIMRPSFLMLISAIALPPSAGNYTAESFW